MTDVTRFGVLLGSFTNHLHHHHLRVVPEFFFPYTSKKQTILSAREDKRQATVFDRNRQEHDNYTTSVYEVYGRTGTSESIIVLYKTYYLTSLCYDIHHVS
jgi:hypothetical protein